MADGKAAVVLNSGQPPFDIGAGLSGGLQSVWRSGAAISVDPASSVAHGSATRSPAPWRPGRRSGDYRSAGDFTNSALSAGLFEYLTTWRPSITRTAR